MEAYISYVIYSSINVTRVTICQVNLQNNKTKAIKHILKILKKIGSCDSDILCLPELWYSKIVTHFESEFSEIIDAAKEYNITIIPGAFFERKNKVDSNNNNSIHISSPVISNKGTILGRQLKINPFGLQRKVVKAGTTVQVFDTGSFKFGIGICYDIVFPEVSRALIKKGADILFFPSKIRNEGTKPWHMYVQVRALENRIPIAAPNLCCNDTYKGKSIFVDFDYDNRTDIALPKIRLGSSAIEQILTMDIDFKRTRRIHKKRFENFPNNFYDLL
jgi:omega-amidase